MLADSWLDCFTTDILLCFDDSLFTHTSLAPVLTPSSTSPSVSLDMSAQRRRKVGCRGRKVLDAFELRMVALL